MRSKGRIRSGPARSPYGEADARRLERGVRGADPFLKPVVGQRRDRSWRVAVVRSRRARRVDHLVEDPPAS
jgi:hypothetical protein